jgi:zinc transporter ZupT
MKEYPMASLTTFSWITIFAFTAMVVNTIGIYFIYKNKEWTIKNKDYFLCFAAGVLIAAPLLTAFPEAVESHHDAGLAALAGFAFMFFSNKLIQHRTHQEELAFGITALEGIGIHSFIDGVIYSVTFNVNTMTGILAGVGLVAHEFAEGVITFSVLIAGGMSSKKAFFFAFLVAALTTPVGAFLAYPLISGLSEGALGLSLGFVSGVLIYLSASHLLPEGQQRGKKHSYLAFTLGILVALILFAFH